MSHPGRIRLFLAFAFAALCVPRGVALAWCLCPGTEHADCCAGEPAGHAHAAREAAGGGLDRACGPAGACCGSDAVDEEHSELRPGADAVCSCCHSFEVEDFGQRLDLALLVLPGPAEAAAPPWVGPTWREGPPAGPRSGVPPPRARDVGGFGRGLALRI